MQSTTTIPEIDLSQLQTRMLINGEFRNASGGSTFTLHNPATGQEIARVPQATDADVDAAVQAAKAALHHATWVQACSGCATWLAGQRKSMAILSTFLSRCLPAPGIRRS